VGCNQKLLKSFPLLLSGILLEIMFLSLKRFEIGNRKWANEKWKGKKGNWEVMKYGEIICSYPAI
jgi:hypothetical protein